MLYLVYILRYGDSNLGRFFYGVFSNIEKVKEELRLYNTSRGGKYPVIEVHEVPLDKTVVFQDVNIKTYNVGGKQNAELVQ